MEANEALEGNTKERLVEAANRKLQDETERLPSAACGSRHEKADLKQAHAEVDRLRHEANMRERRAKSMRPSGEELMRELDEVDKDVADEGKCKEEWKMSWVQAEEKEQKDEEESEAAAEQKQVEIQDDSLTQPSHIDRSRVDKPGIQDVTMRKAL